MQKLSILKLDTSLQVYPRLGKDIRIIPTEVGNTILTSDNQFFILFCFT